jgi:DNA-binding CsgD family transcriptional regulator
VLQGRDVEQARVTALLDAARAGRGGALVLRGQPGVGKSVLLADVGDRVPDMTVLRTQGIESESPLAFAALQRLLRPVMSCSERLPAPQAQALRAAMGEAAGGDPDRFLVFLATLSVLAEAAEQRPVLALVDDAHWLDDASAAALQFVARRLENERVALLFASREGDVRQFDSGDLPRLEIGGVDPDAAGRLLAERAGVVVPAAVTEALVAGTGGNPLALAELADALPADQLTGAAPLPTRLPLTGGVERAFLDRYRRLPSSAQAVLLAAAADDSRRLTVVRAAAATLGADDEGWAAAERSALLRVRDAAVELRHPLVRSAVYGGVTSTERRRVHGALAAAMAGGVDADRRAWHLAAAVDEPDAEVVAELDRTAERAAARGGQEAASAAWERAAELSVALEERCRRLASAARAARLVGHTARAHALADNALAATQDPALRADLKGLLAQLEFHGGSVDRAYGMLLAAATEVARFDPRRAVELAMLAAALGAFGARWDTAVSPVDLVPHDHHGATARDLCLYDLVHGLHAVAQADWRTATQHLRRAVDRSDALSTDTDEDMLLNLGVAAWPLGDDEIALRLQDRLLAHAREQGAVIMIVHALTRRNLPELATGRWDAAGRGATEALALAGSSGQPVLAAWPAAVLAVLSAFRGSLGDLEEHAGTVDRLLAGHSLGVVTELVADLVRWARGVRDAHSPTGGLPHWAAMRSATLRHLTAIDRVEAAVRAGRPDLAGAWVDEMSSYAEGSGAPWASAAAAHGRALLAEGATAENSFRRALEFHGSSARTPDRARTELALGSFLRRARRRVEARTHLRAALAVFEGLGAEAWAERARQELRASGETARRRDAEESPSLTPSERQVAALVSEGLSNRDIAGRLFVSPRTVDFHLRNVFSKLGVASRTELAASTLFDNVG